MKNEKRDRNGDNHSGVRKGAAIVKKPQSGRALHAKTLAKSIADKARALLKRSRSKKKDAPAPVVASQFSASEHVVPFNNSDRHLILDAVKKAGGGIPALGSQVAAYISKRYPNFRFIREVDALLLRLTREDLLERWREIGGYRCTKNGEAFLRSETVIPRAEEGSADLNTASVVTAGLGDNAARQDQPLV
ncbi:MAG: hypothetical protein HY459_04865 [Parcubacteria group bacterium]|nr:hypothetical protein [Parcubacteria group bacterium]